MNKHRILIACIGNIFLGDDAFGCRVAEVLAKRDLPPDVKLVDFGIRGIDLAYALMEGYETTILVDATPRGGPPGTIYLIEPEIGDAETNGMLFEPHDMDPLKVIAMVRAHGGTVGNMFVVGCEPEFTNEDGEGHMGLSPSVEAALPEAVEVIGSLIRRTTRGPSAERMLRDPSGSSGHVSHTVRDAT